MSHHGGRRLCVESVKITIYITGFSLFLIVFIQSLHRKIPTITVEELNLNKTASIIYFDLKLDNKNPVGIYYRAMNLTFSSMYYFPNKTTSWVVPLGVYTLRGFHQDHHKETHVRDKLQVVKAAANKVVIIRVDLVGRVKFKSIAQWKRTMVVGINVELDEITGEKITKTGINMVPSGGAALVGCCWICTPLFTLLIFTAFFNFMFL
uniref:uncharacterized protein LOC122611046 n=1 Tax=Erigeron canadensis TaxID=72917 RepID=UPI001CB945E2|nr:uncharacterized protein LOC122611046 [Erigeron canadensis]